MNLMKWCFLGVLLGAAGCTTMDERRGEEKEPDALASLAPKSGTRSRGEMQFFTSGTEVQLKLVVSGLTPGRHAVHLHEKGDCSAPDAESAGPHWNPTNVAHGHLEMPPAHLGDIGNIEVGGDGRGTLVFSTSYWSIGTGRDNDIVGKAVVIHASVDDFASQPAGNSGKRVACGVVRAGRTLPLYSLR